jgi:hypothetical protein
VNMKSMMVVMSFEEMTRQRKSWDVEGLSCCRKMEGLELLLPKYDDKDHKGAVVWINKMDGIF